MKEETKERIDVAKRESRVTEDPSYNAICFHAQQCVEKYPKAFLQEQNNEIIKTHDLVYLLELILPIKPLWLVYRTMLEHLNDYAVSSRYPGEEITKEEAVQAVKFMSEIREVMKEDIR